MTEDLDVSFDVDLKSRDLDFACEMTIRDGTVLRVGFANLERVVCEVEYASAEPGEVVSASIEHPWPAEWAMRVLERRFPERYGDPERRDDDREGGS